MKIVGLKKEQFDNFVINHPLKSMYQTSSYGNTMTKAGYKASYVGFVHNKQLIGATLILSKPIFMGFKYGYAPRGILINFNDIELYKLSQKKFKNYLLTQRYLIFKMDPLIIKSVRNKKGEIIQSNETAESIMKINKKLGYVHCGFNNYFEAVKPRWNALINIENKTVNELFFSLDKQIRNKLRKATKFGVEVFQDESIDIETAYNFIKGKKNDSINYYKNLKEQFGDNFEIFYARVNTENYVYNSQLLYEKEEDKNDKLNNYIQDEGTKGKNMQKILNKKMTSDKVLASYKNHLISATELLKNNPDKLIIGAAIAIRNNDTIHFLIDGYNNKYKNICTGYLLKWKIIEKYLGTDIKIIDLNAITGNFTQNNQYKGLNECKLGYCAKAIEYIGEFKLIVNKPIHALYVNTLDKFNIKEQPK